MNISIKREQNNARISSAEREKFGAKLKTKNIFKVLALAMLMPAMLLTTACSNDDDLVNNTANTENTINKGYALPVTVNVTRQGDATRATYTDNNDGTGSLAFSAGDKLFVEGRDIDGAEYFAGALDYVPATGKFTGTIYTQNEWLGTADELFVAANADQTLYVPTFIATLLPADYADYGFFGINDKGDAYAYNDRVKTNDDYTLATTKAAGIEQLSWEEATSYSSVTGFALEPQNAILNFTVTGLEKNTDVNVFVGHTDDRYNGTKTIRTDNDGNATFVACFPWGNDLQDCSVTVDGTPITIVSSEKNVAKGKIYNITRAKPIVVTWNSSNISDLRVSGTSQSYTKEGITLSANANMIEAEWQGYGDESMDGIRFSTSESGGFTFTAPTGKKFTKIEMTPNNSGGWQSASLGTGWASGLDFDMMTMGMIFKVTWTGTATTTVDLLTGASSFNSGENVKSIVFTLQ